MNVKQKRFKREYIPVILASIILIGLIGTLIFTLNYQRKDLEKPVPNAEFKQEELVIDSSNSKCSAKELKELSDIANKVELDFVETQVSAGFVVEMDLPGAPEREIFQDVYGVVFKNVTDDIYLIVKDDQSKNVKTLTTKDVDSDGKLMYKTLETDVILDYTVEIYASKYDCKDEMLRKVNFTVPIYNVNSINGYCTTYPNFEHCKKFINKDVLNYQEFYQELNNYIEENNLTRDPDDKDLIKYTNNANSNKTTKKSNTTSKNSNQESTNGNYTMYIVIGIIAAIAVLILITVLAKKRSGRK